jgi:tetratricopeptide (TPR) repeat protein
MDSSEWQEESEQKNINTVFTTLDYEVGGGLAGLKKFCDSHSFRLVYIDPSASVFIRATPQTEPLVRKLGKECSAIQFNSPPSGTTLRARAERFIYFRNAAAILLALERPSEALQISSAALDIFPDSGDAHFLKGMALLSRSEGPEAEKELELSVQLGPSDANAENLAGIYRQRKRYQEAFDVLDMQIGRSSMPFKLVMLKGFVWLDLNRPAEALRSFDEAENSSPFGGGARVLGGQFRSQLAQGRANAWWIIAADFERRGLSVEASQAHEKSSRFQHLADVESGPDQ